MAKKTGVYIDRSQINEFIKGIGVSQWPDFTMRKLYACGAALRCDFTANGTEATLDFYYRTDGSTSMLAVGKNLELSRELEKLIENSCTYKSTGENKMYSLKHLSMDCMQGLIEFLEKEEGVICDSKLLDEDDPDTVKNMFQSKIGDKLTIIMYPTGTLTLQGKPEFLYSRAMDYLSTNEEISVTDIIDVSNSFHNTQVQAADVSDELKKYLPHAYGNIDSMIIKILTPSIFIKQIDMELDDYSIYTFPVLRALEGYIKYLLSTKGLAVNKSFKEIFKNGKLLPGVKHQIHDTTMGTELERLYGYFTKNRNDLFHTNSLVKSTVTIKDKKAAEKVIDEVLQLIERSYENIAHISGKEIYHG